MQFRPLPELARPCWKVEEDGAVLVAVDPRTTAIELVTWAVDNLTTAEQSAYRAAYGYGPVGTPLPEALLTDKPVDCFVPPVVRLEPEVRRDLSA